MEIKDKKIGVSQKAIVFNKEGKILIIRRTAKNPIYPLYWDLPGGILDFGEDLRKSILREIKEETGLKVKNLKLIEVGSWFSDKKRFWVTICYRASAVSNKVKLSWEHDDFQWVAPEKFLKMKSHIAVKNILLEKVTKLKGV